MKKEVLVCRITLNKNTIARLLASVRSKYGKHLVGFSQNGGFNIFFSKDILKKTDYYSLLSELSAFGKLNKVCMEEVDLEVLLAEIRSFSYFASIKY